MGQPIIPEPCANCKHFLGLYIEEDEFDEVEVLVTVNCIAFPMGIPEDILNGNNWHRQFYKGDKGIKFEEVLK